MKLKVKSASGKNAKFSIEKKTFYSRQETDTMYGIVRDYLYDHQGQNAVEVSEETGVPRDVIMAFLRQGKISLAEDSKHLLHECSECGALIEDGDLCLECRRMKMYKIMNPATAPKKKNIAGYSTKSNAKEEVSYGRRIRKK